MHCWYKWMKATECYGVHARIEHIEEMSRSTVWMRVQKTIVWEANTLIKQERVEAYRSIKNYNREIENRNTNWANRNKERRNEAKINGV